MSFSVERLMSSLPLAFAYSKHPLSVSHIFCGNWVRRGFDGRSIVQTIDRPGVRHCFRPLLLRQGKRVARKAIITEVDRTLGGIGKESDYNLNEILIKSTTIRPLPSISSLIHPRKSRAKPSPETIDPFLFLASSFRRKPWSLYPSSHSIPLSYPLLPAPQSTLAPLSPSKKPVIL